MNLEPERGYALMVEVAQDGCTQAFTEAGRAYQHGWGVQQSNRRAVQWFLKANDSDRVTGLLRSHPLECAPLGEWEPRWHSLLPREIQQAMRTTMLACKRKKVPHGVAMLIIPYVCTEGEEWAELLRKTRGE